MLIIVIIFIELKFLSDFDCCDFRCSRKSEFDSEFEFIMMTSIDSAVVDDLANICINCFFTSISVINLSAVDFCDIHSRCKFGFQLKLKFLLNLSAILPEDVRIVIIFVIIMRLRTYDISIIMKEIENRITKNRYKCEKLSVGNQNF